MQAMPRRNRILSLIAVQSDRIGHSSQAMQGASLLEILLWYIMRWLDVGFRQRDAQNGRGTRIQAVEILRLFFAERRSIPPRFTCLEDGPERPAPRPRHPSYFNRFCSVIVKIGVISTHKVMGNSSRPFAKALWQIIH
jgi:hypothetical protein